MLDLFSVSHRTDGKTVCRITVEPQKRQCSVTVTIDSRISTTADETDASFRSVSPAEWSSPAYWESRAATISRKHSPFWRGETAA